MAKEETRESDRRARLRAKRAVLGVFIAVASVFIGLSALQIVPAVFGLGVTPLAGLPDLSGPTPRGCSEGVRRLAAALDRAAARAVEARGDEVRSQGRVLEEKQAAADEEAALQSFRAALAPEWDGEEAVAALCKDDPRGEDAFAALLRLRLAEEHFLRKELVEIAPLRRDVAAYLPN